MATQALNDAYFDALATLAKERGTDAALRAAAVTLAHYHTSLSAGFFRGKEPLLYIREEKPDSGTSET